MRPRFLELLRAFDEHAVELVVVGGVAAILEGAPITTLDLDFVYRVEASNLERLAAALAEIEAKYRDPGGRLVHPTASRLRTNRVNLLETHLGLVDAMQEIGAGWMYDDVVPRARTRSVADLAVRVLGLAAVIESKEAAGREKDVAMLPVLRRTLEALRTKDEG